MWNPELVIQYSGRHSTPDVPPDEGRVVLSEADISSTTSPYVCSRTCAAARGFTVVYAALVAKVALSPLRAARGGRGGGMLRAPGRFDVTSVAAIRIRCRSDAVKQVVRVQGRHIRQSESSPAWVNGLVEWKSGI